MRALLPIAADDVDPVALYMNDDRPAAEHAPWVIISMVASVDGATAVDGRSGLLGGEGDKVVFRAIRAVADVILVAAGTVRAENYGPPRATDEVQELRASRGQAPQPRLAILSRHLDLAPTARFLAEAEPANRPWLVTVEDADAAKLQALTPQMDEVIVAGTGSVNLPTALTAMQRLGARVVLVEGGPTLNGQLLTADLVDETCLTIAPDLVGGPSSRIATGGTEHVQGLVLDRVLEHDNALFLRYRRRK